MVQCVCLRNVCLTALVTVTKQTSIPIAMFKLKCPNPWEKQHNPLIARFMGQTWGPPGTCQPQVGPMLAPWTLQSGPFSLHASLNHCIGCSLLHTAEGKPNQYTERQWFHHIHTRTAWRVQTCIYIHICIYMHILHLYENIHKHWRNNIATYAHILIYMHGH